MNYVEDPTYAQLVRFSLDRGDPRFILHAFLCDGPCMKDYIGEGTLTFTQIFVSRPDSCRYAVVEAVNQPSAFLVVDMYETTYDDRQVYMGPFVSFPTLDAAVMLRMLNYD